MTDSRQNILTKIEQALTSSRPAVLPSNEDLRVWPDDDWPVEELIAEFAKKFQAVAGTFHLARSLPEFLVVLKEIFSPLEGRPVLVGSSAVGLIHDLKDILLGFGIIPCLAGSFKIPEAVVGITGVQLALAYSGSLVVPGDQVGDLAASLLPPVHVALIPADRLIFRLDQAVSRLSWSDRTWRTVFITGPSKTADIELTLVHGVHGPGRVHAVLMDFEGESSLNHKEV